MSYQKSYRQTGGRFSRNSRQHTSSIRYEYLLGGEEINKELFSDIADKVARSFYMKVNMSKLRQYYEVIVNLQASKQNNHSKEIELRLLVAKAVYDRSRKVVDYNFVDFLKNGINFIISNQELDFSARLNIFKKHFEAIIGYASQYLKNN